MADSPTIECISCSKPRYRTLLAPVEVGGETYYVCDRCMDDHDGPGKFEGCRDDLALALTLYGLSMISGEDFMLTDESQGYAGVFDRYILTEDERGFIDVLECASLDAALAEVYSWERDGFGASEYDSWITPDRNGYSVSFDGKYLGTYPTERRARAALSVAYRKTGYFPNAFLEDDHGGLRMVSIW